ncbi:MAG: phosphatidylserine/phosphatidylglycerophosphate/cardiolipin synthase family protein [Deltaproteobacteria bacterium]|nr:phosphatidylserine/phosphatidylglycerophosphate/cardiolipin synthase family protein [Deltaproteobacteria bacterium]
MFHRARSLLLCVLVAAGSGACATTTQGHVNLPRPASVRKAFEQLKGNGGTTGVVSLTDNAAAWATRWQLVTSARKSVDLSTFIFDDDVFGFALLGALTERARAGVKVRMLLDGRGSLGLASSLLGRDYLQEMVETGKVDVHIYNPPLDELVGALLKLDAVRITAGSHNKILVVDDATAIVGGRNVNSHYFATLDEDAGAVADADLVLDGRKVVAEVKDIMVREFSSWKHDNVAADAINFSPQLDELLMFAGAMDTWVRGEIEGSDASSLVAALEQAARKRIDHRPDDGTLDKVRARLRALVGFPSVRGTLPIRNVRREQVDVRVVATLSVARAVKSNAVTDAMLRAIGGARREIVLQSPSFILNPPLLLALQEASARGVAITLFTNGPSSSDSKLALSLFIDSWPELMARIPTLRIFTERSKQMQHAKRAVFDDDLSFVGTYNLDPFSTKLNSETVIAVWSATLAARIRDELKAHQVGMDEYLIARNEDGSARRHPDDHPKKGQVVVVWGPRDQVSAELITELENVKGLMTSVQNLWNFDVVTW